VVYNAYLVVPLATWAITQIAKFAISAIRGRIDIHNLYASGGMPSVHSAVVCSLGVTALLVDGPSSHLFGFTAVFAAIVMYDSFGVRRASGEQSVAINMLIGSLGRGKIRLDKPELKLREVLGHRPSEVGVGAVVGIVLGLLFNANTVRAGKVFTFLKTIPSHYELIAYGALGLILTLGALTQRFIFRRFFTRSKALRRLSSQIMTAGLTIGLIEIILVVFAYENATYISWRGWSDFVLAIGLIWGLAIASHFGRRLPDELAAEASVARKMKWIVWGKRKRSK
jgi:acid phosphatase family membrane protein YuiD